jgi:RHS repeat-associated protein
MQLHYSTRNMPLEIVFDEGLIRNTYRPDGVKTNKMVYDGKGRLTTNETYLGNLVLNFGVPSQILHPEGVVDVSNLSQPVVHYHLKGHLGNVRAVVNPSATNTALISQTNDYYPFGMCYTKMPGPFVNKRKYNGKEEQEMPGRWLDYGARFYDPQLGRWHGVDPLAEKYRRWTPYNYCVNNPMRFVDPDGMEVIETANWITYTGADAVAAFLQLKTQMESRSNPNQKRNNRQKDESPFGTMGEEGDDPQGQGGTISLLDGAPSQDFSGFWGGMKYFWTGGNIDGYHYNIDGIATSFSPNMGMPPSFIGGPLRKGEQALKLGKYLFNPTALHAVKKGFLSLVNPKNFSHIVGTNPDLMFKGGKIWLTGTKLGGYYGKSYETGMTIADFLKLF